MAATIEIGRYTVVLEDGVWRSDPPLWAEFFNDYFEDWEADGSDPNPELTMAEEAAHILGGRVLTHDPPEYEAGRVY